MRLHGDREPHSEPLGTSGGGICSSGADNEVWSYGPEVYEICKKYLEIRYRIKPYIKKLMREAHEKGTPVIRPLFYDFHEDKTAWQVEDQYMFGPDVLVAPILYPKMEKRKVYLPEDTDWKNAWTGEEFQGGQTIEVDAPIDIIPLFLRKGVELSI